MVERDQMRGVDPERFDLFARNVDAQLAEMSAVFLGDKPARLGQAARLMTQTLALQVHVEKFAAEIRKAL